ncbi:MAG TPA: BolA family transcriptional regulator [Alphaproteobacteria bacterium]|nr:BolA family transcriptional regulator [Alphaproteobacteria bacterium]
MSVAGSMKETLTLRFAPLRLDIVDLSNQHVGHPGSRPGGESHFRVEIVSAAFENKNRVERQRMVYDAVAGELEGGLHALSLKTITPGEDK